MSLLDIAQSIKKEGFDPRKDSANGPAPIPAGEYFRQRLGKSPILF